MYCSRAAAEGSVGEGRDCGQADELRSSQAERLEPPPLLAPRNACEECHAELQMEGELTEQVVL